MLPFPQMPKIFCGPAVYFLYSGQELVYVGQSTNPASRVVIHERTSGMAFNSVRVLPQDVVDLSRTELAYIRRYCPRYNDRGLNGSGQGTRWEDTAITDSLNELYATGKLKDWKSWL